MGEWLTDDVRERFRAIGSRRTLLERDTLFREGDEAYDIALTEVGVTVVRSLDFLAFLLDNPESMRELFSLTIRRLRDSNARHLEYASADALGRVCHRLEDIAARSGSPPDDPTTIELGLTQAEFAQWCGLSREAVVKSFRKLRTLGWVDQEGGSVTLNDRLGLRARAAQ